jgi:hypothetical protein
MVEVLGATLPIVDIGPRDAAGAPIVMLHGCERQSRSDAAPRRAACEGIIA